VARDEVHGETGRNATGATAALLGVGARHETLVQTVGAEMGRGDGAMGRWGDGPMGMWGMEDETKCKTKIEIILKKPKI
jgi:hypothetical protein